MNNIANGQTEVEAYDPRADSWTSMAPMPIMRFGHAAATVEGKIYVFGGKSTVNTAVFGTLEVYDPAANSWTTESPMPTARGLLSASVVNGRIYAIGGTLSPGSQQFDTVEMYDPATDNWAAKSPMPTARFALASSAVNGKIYAIGGGFGLTALRTVEEYDPVSDTWTTRADMPTKRHAMPGAVVNGRIYVSGGSDIVSIPHQSIPTLEEYTPPGGSGINAGHAGAWFNPETSGQGQFIDVVPEDQFMFISWFTFTNADSDHPFEQHWFTAQGTYSGNTAVLDLFETLGGKFDDPQEVTTTQIGEVILSFSDCEQGQMTYSLGEEELQGKFPLIRVIGGSGNVCEGLSGNTTAAVDINAGMDGAWFNSNTPGQGFFIDAHPGGNFIFVSWFTFGDETASGQRWLTAQGSFEGSTAEIDVFETTGGSFDDPLAPSTIKVGTMSLDFTDCSNAQLSYSLSADPAEGDITITRVIPGSQALCEELTGAD
jgi:hypothetical protein